MEKGELSIFEIDSKEFIDTKFRAPGFQYLFFWVLLSLEIFVILWKKCPFLIEMVWLSNSILGPTNVLHSLTSVPKKVPSQKAGRPHVTTAFWFSSEEVFRFAITTNSLNQHAPFIKLRKIFKFCRRNVERGKRFQINEKSLRQRRRKLGNFCSHFCNSVLLLLMVNCNYFTKVLKKSLDLTLYPMTFHKNGLQNQQKRALRLFLN